MIPSEREADETRRARITSVAFVAIGAGLIALAFSVDLFAAHVHNGFGVKQRLLLLAGLGLLVSGIVLWPTLRTLRRAASPWLAVIFLAALASVLATSRWESISSWVLLAYLAAACVLLRRGLGALSFVAAVAIAAALSVINAAKVNLTGLPLTMFDLRIAISDPRGLWNALKLPTWTLYATLGVLVGVILWWGVASLNAVYRLFARRRDRRSMTLAGARLLGIALVTVAASTYLQDLYARARLDDSTWEPKGVSKLAQSMGILPFLGYSYTLEAAATGDYYASSPGAAVPGRNEIRTAVLNVASFATGSGARPNIIMVLAESTFDPGATFRIQGAWNNSLFERDERVAAAGPLRVNAVGGGTWITEFETLVGIDSRVFGYSGYYTHASIGPFVTRSLASHLVDRGYHSIAFIPTDGGFFNTRRAYQNYGFETILDSRDLGRHGFHDWLTSDVEIAELVKGRLGREPSQPFFAYVLLIENHYPHDCHLPPTHKFTTRFVETDEFEPNCSLYEYLRRLDATSDAVARLRHYLQDLERDTGRPYVLAVFGDHQPATFTGAPVHPHDFTRYRKGPNLNLTFFRVEAPTSPQLHCCAEPLPATALPTLVSAFAADGPDDVYLGVNLWLFERCGPDAVHRKFGDYLAGMASDGSAVQTSDCQKAYERALAWYRAAGIVRLPGGAARP